MNRILWLPLCAFAAFAQEAAPPPPSAAPAPPADVPLPPLAARMQSMHLQMSAQADRASRAFRRDSDPQYDQGTRALDGGKWDEAARIFGQVAERKGDRADGALYWKAYSENKLGQRDAALATIGALRKEYPTSRWMDDAKALEVEVRQQTGQPVSPNSESSDDLKMLALNGLLQSDPEQAIPIIEKILKSNNAPKLKDRALFVLTQSRSPKAQQILVDVAKGGANPDLQIRALRYVAMSGQDSRATLYSIYSSSNDVAVKKAILGYFQMSKFTDANDPMVNIAKNEKNPELRKSAIHMMGTSSRTSDALIAIYGGEQDPEVKKQIIDALFIQNNSKALIDLAKKETNPTVKKEIVQKLSIIHSPEATQYMLEILSK
jgi:tetratricopeptide (TPR) repeat protein